MTQVSQDSHDDDRIISALQRQLDDLEDLVSIANFAGEQLHGRQADQQQTDDLQRTVRIGAAYQTIVNEIAARFEVDCVVLATWEEKTDTSRNVYVSANSEALPQAGLRASLLKDGADNQLDSDPGRRDVIEAIPKDKLSDLYRTSDFTSWEEQDLHNIDGTTKPAFTSGMLYPLQVALDSLRRPIVIGFLGFMFAQGRHVSKRWPLLMKHVAGILSRAAYNVLRPYIGPRRIAEGSYELEEFFKERERYCTFLFADLRNFTAITEALRIVQRDKDFQKRIARQGKGELSIHRILKEYHDLMVRVLKDNVRILEFSGDGIYAVFCNLLADEGNTQADLTARPPDDVRRRDCLKALCSAIQMQIAFGRLKKRWDGHWMNLYRQEYNEEFDLYLGVGINTGPAAFTNLGAEDYTRFSCVGDQVNFASRLCGEAGQLDVAGGRRPTILLSQTTHAFIEPWLEESMFDVQYLEFKGKSGRYPIHGLAGNDPDQLSRAIKINKCQLLFKNVPQRYYFCKREDDKQFICNCDFHGDAFSIDSNRKYSCRLPPAR